jgi:hypothetical protein
VTRQKLAEIRSGFLVARETRERAAGRLEQLADTLVGIAINSLDLAKLPDVAMPIAAQLHDIAAKMEASEGALRSVASRVRNPPNWAAKIQHGVRWTDIAMELVALDEAGDPVDPSARKRLEAALYALSGELKRPHRTSS